ncbi:MAG TPA: ribosomal-processing cysteine protease Prp [Thermoclostridium sp.]|nr:ribosomal-processing cysteine protease Prp [Clostridiaceae bacterium]HOQ75193.1 ribosomal-processing cysteine protease Prp [Thermoclostridium sp.]HPU44712.1 ribosomal-processing cysteine protease Prp [Thermoclostridium sp.]
MTKATIYRSKNGLIRGFRIRGHAGASRQGDYDLVCAAISAIGYTAIGALTELCGIKDYSESDGNLEMMLPDNISPDVSAKAETVLETLEIGLKQVERQYSRHLRVLNEEV